MDGAAQTGAAKTRWAGAVGAGRGEGGAGGDPGGESVVDDHHCLVGQVRMRPVAAVAGQPAVYLGAFPLDERLDLPFVEAEVVQQGAVEDGWAVLGDGAQAHLGLSRDTDLAGDDEVEVGVDGPGDLVADRNTAAGQREYQRPAVMGDAVEVGSDDRGQRATGLGAVGEWVCVSHCCRLRPGGTRRA